MVASYETAQSDTEEGCLVPRNFHLSVARVSSLTSSDLIKGGTILLSCSAKTDAIVDKTVKKSTETQKGT